MVRTRTFLIVLIFVLIGLKSSAQNNEKYIPLIISIDGHIPTKGLYTKGNTFLIVDSTKKVIDSIPFNYIFVGRAFVSDSGYRKIFSLNHHSYIIVKFGYSRSYDLGRYDSEDEDYKYEATLRPYNINDIYILLNIYNYSNPINNNYYPNKAGYGVEVYSPSWGSILPVKKLIPYKPLKKWKQ